jgi:hypothetical protein
MDGNGFEQTYLQILRKLEDLKRTKYLDESQLSRPSANEQTWQGHTLARANSTTHSDHLSTAVNRD